SSTQTHRHGTTLCCVLARTRKLSTPNQYVATVFRTPRYTVLHHHTLTTQLPRRMPHHRTPRRPLPKHRDLDNVIVPSLRTAFYVNSAARNEDILSYTQLTHVQLNHGESDKGPSFSPVFRSYDKDFVAGQAAIDRFAANGVAMPESMFSIVGRPQVEDVQIADKPIEQVPGPTVLYAPTWAGFNADANYSSLQVGHHIISSLLARGCTVIFR